MRLSEHVNYHDAATLRSIINITVLCSIHTQGNVLFSFSRCGNKIRSKGSSSSFNTPYILLYMGRDIWWWDDGWNVKQKTIHLCFMLFWYTLYLLYIINHYSIINQYKVPWTPSCCDCGDFFFWLPGVFILDTFRRSSSAGSIK